MCVCGGVGNAPCGWGGRAMCTSFSRHLAPSPAVAVKLQGAGLLKMKADKKGGGGGKGKKK